MGSIEEQLIEDKENKDPKPCLRMDKINNGISPGLTSAINSLDDVRDLPIANEPLDPEKIEQIQDVIQSSPLDIEKLRELAICNGGLVTDKLRRRAWPLLMMVGNIEPTEKPSETEIQSHKYYNQVVMDVNRSLKRFPPGIEDDHRLILMGQLTNLIVRVLIKHPELHYYQGFHDVAITFLLVVGEDMGYELVERLSMAYLRDFMRPTMEKTTYYLTYIYPILDKSNPKLCQYLIESGVGTMFCLPWLITWFAHTLGDYRNVVRLYDFFLSSPYLMPMYTAAAIVMQREKEIFEVECDMAMQHQVLSQVADSLPFEELLITAKKLYDLYPPDSLKEDVDKFIEDKKKKELEEYRQAQHRKELYQKRLKAKQGNNSLQVKVLGNYFGMSQNMVKIIGFALVATLATSLYGYITKTKSLEPYSFWNW